MTLETKLDSSLYQDCYRRFEFDKYRNNSLSKSMADLGRNVKAICGVGSIALLGCLSRKLGNYDLSAETGIVACASAASICLTIHMHETNFIFNRMYHKNIGEVLTEEEKEGIRCAGKLGRNAHTVAAASVVGAVGILSCLDPIFLAMAPIIPFWYHYVIRKGYGDFYSAAVDYTTAENK